MALRLRLSARIFILDPQKRVLLLNFVFKEGALAGQSFWATPGGAVEEGETFEQAARRELFEETGFIAADLGEALLERHFTMVLPSGEEVQAREQFFLFQAGDKKPVKNNFTEEEKSFLEKHHWWTIEELQASPERIFPPDIVAVLQPLINC